MTQESRLDRREAVRRLALLAVGVAATGCTPLRVVLRLYPEKFDRDLDLVDRVLRAFVATVIPGAPIEDPDLVRAYYDPYYPLAKYVDFFASDLCGRSERLFGDSAFDRLTPEERTRVIQDGLAADHTTARLYNGAILLGQVAFYASIYNDTKGCDLIGYEGRYQFRGLDAITYPQPESFFARATTADGNPV
jgi:hypothetical protein